MMKHAFRRSAPARVVAVALLMILTLAGCDLNQTPPLAPPTTGGEVSDPAPVDTVRGDQPDPSPAGASYAAMEEAVVRRINDVRRSKGLGALASDATIATRARFHSQEMASGRVPFGHDGFDQRADTLSRAIPLWGVGENVAMNLGYADPVAKAVDGWLRSPGHYENIVGDYNRTGVGIDRNARGEYYLTQMFVKSR